MARASEILFVDPSISDLETVLSNVRPGIEAILVDGRQAPAAQMAAALRGHEELHAVHIIAHGAPGRVVFASGEWSVGTLKGAAEEFAAIGRALAADGELRLWSCETARGNAGDAFVDALEAAVGVDVCASSSLVGAAVLGGAWELPARAGASAPLPPLTPVGVASYIGVLAAADLTLTGDITAGGSSSAVNTYYIV
ncbi:DUF4347 domain-containing protein, partial [Mesorhizobium sp. M1A.F.Ca.IN.020.06.1.1]